MPDLIDICLNRTALYWEATGLTDDFGRPRFLSPIEIEVNWNETKSNNGQKGGTQAYDASITTPTEVKPGSLIWFGEEADWYGTGSAAYDTGLMTIESVKWSTDCRGREDLYTAQLKRSKDLPTNG